MTYTVRLEQAASRPLAILRLRAPMQQLSKVVPGACGTVWNVMRSQQVAGAGRHVALYFDCEVNLEVGVELEQPFGGFGEVVDSSTPAGLVATTTHFGPYQLLGHAHDAIQQWCQSHGHTPAGPQWEIYGHWEDEWNRDASKIRTDIYYLLASDATARPNDS